MINGYLRIHCHRQRRRRTRISRPILHCHRQRIITVAPRRWRCKAPASSPCVAVNEVVVPLCVTLTVTLITSESIFCRIKVGRVRLVISSPRTGIIRAIQRNGRRRQPGVDENSSVCVAVLPALSVTMTVRVCFPSPISVGRIAPDAFDTLRRAYPVCAPINA